MDIFPGRGAGSRFGGRLAPLTMKEHEKSGKLTKDDLAKLIDRPGRHGDGQGLYFRAIGEKKAYFVYRDYLAGKEREVSIGPYPEVSLAEARIKHAALRKIVVSDKRDPLADKRAAKASASASASAPKPTFGQIADQLIETHEFTWRSRKHAAQWRSTLTDHASAIRITPVDQIDTQAVLGVLKPIWDKTPETASRTPRARIEAVLASAQVAGHIPDDPAEPGPMGQLARDDVAQPAQGRQAARPPYGDALRRSASLLGAAHARARRRGQGARLRHPDRGEYPAKR